MEKISFSSVDSHQNVVLLNKFKLPTLIRRNFRKFPVKHLHFFEFKPKFTMHQSIAKF